MVVFVLQGLFMPKTWEASFPLQRESMGIFTGLLQLGEMSDPHSACLWQLEELQAQLTRAPPLPPLPLGWGGQQSSCPVEES